MSAINRLTMENVKIKIEPCSTTTCIACLRQNFTPTADDSDLLFTYGQIIGDVSNSS